MQQIGLHSGHTGYT